MTHRSPLPPWAAAAAGLAQMPPRRRHALARRALALAAGLALSACGPDLIELRLQGRVSDAATGAPIAGAGVLLTWTRGSFDLEAIGTVTGPDGRYRLLVSRFPCDAPALTVGGGAYDAETRDVSCSESEQVIDFELSP